jgi:hypothetical protein
MKNLSTESLFTVTCQYIYITKLIDHGGHSLPDGQMLRDHLWVK